MAIAINPVDKCLIVVIELSFSFSNAEMPLARLAEVTDFVEDLVQSSSVVSFDLLMLTTQRAASVGCFFHIRPSLRPFGPKRRLGDVSYSAALRG
jgi:hypothetical protein